MDSFYESYVINLGSSENAYMNYTLLESRNEPLNDAPDANIEASVLEHPQNDSQYQIEPINNINVEPDRKADDLRSLLSSWNLENLFDHLLGTSILLIYFSFK